MSKMIDEMREELGPTYPQGYLSRRHVENIKLGIPEVILCSSCGETLPKGHFLGAHNSENQWEPFCRECYNVTMDIRKAMGREWDS